MRMSARQSGFSLVELSIVLVILGLLVGGILGGQSLIHAAELRSVTVEYDKFQTAINTFKQKYFALPGDMKNATQFWGRADNGSTSGQCANPTSDTGTGTQTCNGDGTGYISDADGEPYRFWQHLSNAKLIEGKFSGVQGPAGMDDHVAGVNAPASKAGGTWGVDNEVPGFTPPSIFWTRVDEEYNSFYLGAQTGYDPIGPQFTPEDVWNIDTKLDDGKPGTGKVHAIQWETCTDADDGTDFETANYLLSETDKACAINFNKVF